MCNRAGCECEVAKGEDYCGDYCRQEPYYGLESRLHTCRCGHDACGSVSDPAIHT
jgi:hypothetical protein